MIYARETTLDTSGMKKYEKKQQRLGCAELSRLFPLGTEVMIRTLEGDINLRVEKDIFIMIGIEGEVYPIKREKLESSYTYSEEPFDRTFEYDPSVTDAVSGERKSVLKYARSVLSTGSVRIYAKPLTEHIKLFTAWDEERYYSGEPGDYIVVREDDPHDIYVINKRLFDGLYREVF